MISTNKNTTESIYMIVFTRTKNRKNDLRVSRVGKELPMSTGYMIEARDIMDVLGISKTRMLTSSPSHLI